MNRLSNLETKPFTIEQIPKKDPNIVYTAKNPDTNQYISINGVEYIMVTLRKAVEKVSLGLGQGFVRCNCGGKCATNACSCFKSQIGCNTKCHQRHSNCQNDGSKWSKPSNYLDEEEEDEEE